MCHALRMFLYIKSSDAVGYNRVNGACCVTLCIFLYIYSSDTVGYNTVKDA